MRKVPFCLIFTFSFLPFASIQSMEPSDTSDSEIMTPQKPLPKTPSKRKQSQENDPKRKKYEKDLFISGEGKAETQIAVGEQEQTLLQGVLGAQFTKEQVNKMKSYDLGISDQEQEDISHSMLAVLNAEASIANNFLSNWPVFSWDQKEKKLAFVTRASALGVGPELRDIALGKYLYLKSGFFD